MSESDFILVSDGGSDEQTSGAGAVIVRFPAEQQRLKLIGMLGPMSGSQVELAAALIGLAAVAEWHPAPEASIHWLGDNEALLNSSTSIREWRERGWRTNADRPVANRGLWEAFILLTEGRPLSVAHIRGHSGHRENEACDRAARWIQRKGEKLLAIHGAGKVGQLARSAPAQAWVLIDARPPFHALLNGADVAPAVESLRAIIRPHLLQMKN